MIALVVGFIIWWLLLLPDSKRKHDRDRDRSPDDDDH